MTLEATANRGQLQQARRPAARSTRRCASCRASSARRCSRSTASAARSTTSPIPTGRGRAAGRAAAMARRHRCALSRRSAAASARLRRLGEEVRPAARGFHRHHRRHGDGRAAGHPRARHGDARSLLRPRRERRRPAVGERVRHAARGRRPARASSRPRAATDQHPARHRRGRGLGRLYLPREGLLLAGITSNDPAKVVADRALPKVCLPLAERAKMHFAKADEIMARNRRRAVRAPRIMGKYYRAILDLLLAARICGAARAGSREQDHEAWYHLPLRFHLMQKTVHIIGAGISGLSAAVRLANAGYRVQVHEATQQVGRPLPFLFRRGDQPHHRQRQSSAAVGQPSRAGLCALDRHRGGTGRDRRSRNSRSSISRPASAGCSISASSRLPLWVFDESRRVPDTGVLDYLALAPLAWASTSRTVGDAIRCEGTLYIGWCSHCCSRRSMSIRPRVRRGLPARWCAKRCSRAGRPAGR